MKTIFINFGGWKACAYFGLLFLAFSFFQQSDLIHTFTSSYAYLGGHFSDFYDFNKSIVGGNDYLPLLYIIYAIWNLPLLFLGLIPTAEHLAISDLTIQLMWSKVLLVCFFFSSAYVIGKIANQLKLGGQVNCLRNPELLFLTAPLAIFAVFIFGQYDIIGVFFALVGFLYYLKKKFLQFAIFFSIAISFKYFALVIYIPLVLLIEKTPLKIIRYFLIGLTIVFFQLLLYWHSEIFRAEIFHLATNKVTGGGRSYLWWKAPSFYMGVFYSIFCLYLFLKNFTNDFERWRMAVFIPIFSYALMFNAVAWHPQWLIIGTPFFALAYLYINNAKLLVLADLIGMLGFLVLCVNIWPNNVDVSMLHLGILKQLIPGEIWLGADFLSQKLVRPSLGIFYIYIYFPIIILLYQLWCKKTIIQNEMTANLIFLRFIVGSGMFLLVGIAGVVSPILFS